ncbi:hypothetical protein Tco_1111101 [Tanacetum coccineum]|uniref:Uncharacterized protein n=1 Tax=Tanacetum coccineum TaxID=301880 RepID=A0ABQ5IN45_9ASTR
MSELNRCYTMLQELRSMIIGGALIDKNHEVNKHKGQRIHPTIGDYARNCANPRSTMEELKNGKRKIRRIEPWRYEVNGKYDFKQNLYFFSWKGKRIAMVPPIVIPQLPKPKVKVEEKILKAEVVDEHIEKSQDLQTREDKT